MLTTNLNSGYINGAVAQTPVRSEAAVKPAPGLLQKLQNFFVGNLDTPSSGSHLRYVPTQMDLEARAEANRDIGKQLAA